MTHPATPAWAEIIERHAERVFRIGFRILGSIHDAEDVSQDVFTEAMKLHSSHPVRSWTGLMVRLATVRSIDRLRRNHGQPKTIPSDDVAFSMTSQPDQVLIANELAAWLRSEIQMLPDQQAAIFSLAYFEQLSRNEIATALDVSPEAVSTTLYKTRQKLSRRLTVHHGESS